MLISAKSVITASGYSCLKFYDYNQLMSWALIHLCLVIGTYVEPYTTALYYKEMKDEGANCFN